jgi:hypothetical protein
MIDDKERLDRLELEVKAIVSAFPKESDGTTDYAAHKIFHKNQTEAEESNKKKRSAVITNLITWIVVGMITIGATSLAQNWPLLAPLIPK